MFDALLQEETLFRTEADRIRAIFGLPDGALLPQVTAKTLVRYHAYLVQHLTFPFRALYAGTAQSMGHVVRYVTVLGLMPPDRFASQGIHCQIEGIPNVGRMPLVDLGVPDDHPNHRAIDDFAYWYSNCW